MPMLLDRRQWMIGAIASVTGLSSMKPACAGAQHGEITLLGAQLFMVDALLRADLDFTLEAIARIGFRSVEIAGYWGPTTAAMARAIRKAGLLCTSAHVQGRDRGDGAPHLERPIHSLIDDAHGLGVKTIVLASFLFPDSAPPRRTNERLAAYVARIGNVMDADAWRRTADRLNGLGAPFAREGLRVSYHNHNAEFAPLSAGGTGMDILLRDTDPAIVDFEMDAGWVAAAGEDPVALIHRYPGRFRQMHVKNIARDMPRNFVFRQTAAPLGNGAIDWSALLRTAREAGIGNFYVEQDPPYADDTLNILDADYRYLSRLAA
jgi:sugar phosphate isomerase/epimerase